MPIIAWKLFVILFTIFFILYAVNKNNACDIILHLI